MMKKFVPELLMVQIHVKLILLLEELLALVWDISRKVVKTIITRNNVSLKKSSIILYSNLYYVATS